MLKTTAVLAAAALLAGSPAAAQANWATPTKPYRIIDNTYYVGTDGLAVYLITGPQGHILIDGGLPQDAALVEASVKALGFKLSDIKFILNTHGHYDHAGGLAKLKADTGAVLLAGQGERYALEKGVYPGSEDRKDFNFPPVAVDGEVADGQVVSLGGLHVTAHLTPGHTKGCTSWTWPVKDRDGSAHTALLFCSASVAANSLVPPQYPGIVADYNKTFATAPSLKGDLFLAPHSEQFGAKAKRARLGQPGPNPFIDRAGYERLIASQKADFVASLAKAQAGRP